MNNYNPRPQANTYQARYRRSPGTAMTKLYATGPYIVALVSFFIAVAALVSLLSVDVITGRVTASHMTNPVFGWFSSLGTTGLILAMIGTAFYGVKEGWSWKVVVPIFILSLVPCVIDVYFDGMSVDIIRFGYFIKPSLQFASTPAEILPHELYRIMVGALSAVGEPLAAGSVIIFPIMRELFKGVFSNDAIQSE